MAHDYKLAPVLDNKELDVWVKLTELPEAKAKKAKKAALQLAIKDLKVREGVIKLKEKLDKTFSKDKKKATYDAYDKFERFKRSNEMYKKFEKLKFLNEMSLADYTIEFEELIYCLKKHEIKLPPVILAYRYLNSANLTEVQSTIVRTTISDYAYDNMVQQVEAVYSESKQEQSEEKIKINIEDES